MNLHHYRIDEDLFCPMFLLDHSLASLTGKTYIFQGIELWQNFVGENMAQW